MNNIISLAGVTKIYSGIVPTKALQNVSLSIQQGAMTAIIGQSGSGKSTLLNMIGILDAPTSGTVVIDGIQVHALSSDEKAVLRNQVLGFVFQFHYLLPEFSVLENVMMPGCIRDNLFSRQRKDRAMELLEMVGLSDVADKSALKISGGQKQRTAIARALMNNPKILLADEPTGNLDSENSMRVYELFCRINRQYKTTFVVITHSKEIARQAERIIQLSDGKILRDSPNTNRSSCRK